MPSGHRNQAPYLRAAQAQWRRKEQRRWVGLGMGVALLLYVIIFGDAGWLAVRSARSDVRGLELEIERTRRERMFYEGQESAVRQPGSEALERAARERFRMHAPGEEVHHLIGTGEAAPSEHDHHELSSELP